MASIKTKGTKDSKATTKKQGKAKSEPELVIPDAWINELASLEINDDDWSCSVVIIEETTPEASIYLEEFNDAATNGNRVAVKAISKTVVVEFVKTTILKEQSKRASALDLLCKEIYTEVGPDFEKMIPTSLLAYLLKYIILEYKELNKHIRINIMNKNKEVEDYRQSLWPPSIKNVSAKSGKTGIKSEVSGNRGINQPKTKVFTKLRKRGEEWKDTIWIDDAPDNGPQLYVAMSNFYDPSLPLELLNLNVPLDAIIELDVLFSDDKTHRANTLNEMHNSILNLIRKRKTSDRDKALWEKKKTKIRKFWNGIDNLKLNLPTSLMFKNVMFLQLVPNQFNFLNETQTFQGEIYRQISHFMYDIFENYKLHKAYLDELEITDVTDDCIQESPNMQIYNSILDSLPHEALTIACILDAILAQVCRSESNEQSHGSEEVAEPHWVSGKLDSLLKYLQRLNMEYDILQEPDIESDTDFDTSTQSLKHISAPIKNILIHGDDVSIKTFHLEKDIENFITNRTKHVLKSAWENFWTKHFVPHDNDCNFIRLCNVIIKSENERDQHVLYYYVYIMIVNCILDSILLSSDFVQTEHLRPTICRSSKEDLCLYNKADLCEDCLHEIGSAITILDSFHRLSSKGELVGSLEVSDTEATSTSTSTSTSYSLTAEIIANNLFYIEDMPSDVLLQNLQTEFTRFNRFDARYCSFNEQLVIVFHNLFSIGDSWEESWVGKLTTNVPARDFVEYTVEEEYPWFDNYIKQSPTQPLAAKNMNCLPADELGIPITFTLSDIHFLSHRSLKYERLNKQQVLSKSPRSTKSRVSGSPLTTDGSGNENNQDIFDMSGQDETEIKENSFSKTQKNTNFIGYELGEPQRFQFTGLVKEKLFEDHTKITIQKVQKLYSDETHTLNVAINGHTLYYSYTPNAVSNTPFHIILSSGIILYFGHPSFEDKMLNSSNSLKKKTMLEPLPELEDNCDISSHISDTLGLNNLAETTDLGTPLESFNDSNKFPHEVKEADFHKIPSVYNLKMSTPSGLHVELVQAQHKDILYVRQKLLSKAYKSEMVQQEKLRCYSSSGYIIKFMVGGEIEILGGNGTLYSIYEIKEDMSFDKSSEGINLSSKKDIEEKDKLSLVGKIKKPQKKKSSKRSSKNQSETIKNKVEKEFSTDSDRLLKALEQELKADFHLNIVNYKYTTSDGRQYVVKKTVTERSEDILMITSVDISNNCINSERLDGITSTHYADGSLTVYFPDGSCITSIPVEAEEIFCEWSTSEHDLWFTSATKNASSPTATFSNQHSQSNKDTNSNFEELILPSLKSSPLKSDEGYLPPEITDSIILNKTSEKSLHSILHKNSITSTNDHSSNESIESGDAIMRSNSKIIYSEDGFIVYTLNFVMEHPNYSSVYYDCVNREVEFKLPFSTSVSLKSDGSYRAFFEGVNLMVENDKIYLNRLNGNGKITRTVVVNTTGPIHGSNHEFETERDIAGCFNESVFKLFSLIMQTKLLSFHNIHLYLLYTVNELGNQMFIDFNFNISEMHESKGWHGIQGSEFCCFVINKDLSGFRLINASEIDQHVQFVLKNRGLVRKSENIWNSLLTSLPVLENESQKWFIERNYPTIKAGMKSNVSTFGRRESWTKPFVKQEASPELSLTESEVMIARILHRIPTQENVLSELKMALEEFKSCPKSSNPTKITVESKKGDLNLTEIVHDPSILHKIYEEEREKVVKENDKFRNNMKNTLLRSLIRQACIKARKIRQKNKVEEFKYILKTKHIPPYHLSCFGQVHNILDEVLEHVNSLRKTPSSFARVVSVIDEILNLAITAATENDLVNEVSRANDTGVIREIMSEIFDKFCDLSRQKSYQNLISSILDKPLASVTTEEIELLCHAFQSGAGDCPILYDEEFILQDVLEARHQLSHYFENLKEMFEYYRDHVLPHDSFKIMSVSLYDCK